MHVPAIYVWLGEIYIAVGALLEGRVAEARFLVEQSRVAPTQQHYGSVVAGYRMIASMVSIAEGHVISGLREMSAVRAEAIASGNLLAVMNVDSFVARSYVLLACGELTGSKVKNPGLLMLLPVAGKRARAALEQLLADADSRGFEGIRPLVEFELGRLAKHQRRKKEARTHLEAVEGLLAAEPYATFRHQAKTLLAEL